MERRRHMENVKAAMSLPGCVGRRETLGLRQNDGKIAELKLQALLRNCCFKLRPVIGGHPGRKQFSELSETKRVSQLVFIEGTNAKRLAASADPCHSASAMGIIGVKRKQKTGVCADHHEPALSASSDATAFALNRGSVERSRFTS